jgi:hypothetical protein
VFTFVGPTPRSRLGPTPRSRPKDVVPGLSLIGRCLHHSAVEPEPVQLWKKPVRTFAVVIARRILTRDANQVVAKRQDGIFVIVEGLSEQQFAALNAEFRAGVAVILPRTGWVA